MQQAKAAMTDRSLCIAIREMIWDIISSEVSDMSHFVLQK